MSRKPSRRTSRKRDRARGSESPRIDREERVREFQRKVLDGLASAKAGRLVDGEMALERI